MVSTGHMYCERWSPNIWTGTSLANRDTAVPAWEKKPPLHSTDGCYGATELLAVLAWKEISTAQHSH
jgi:hypothetical protein